MEYLRKIVRHFLSTNTWFYKMGAWTLDFIITTRKCGLKTCFSLLNAKNAGNRNKIPRVLSFNNLLHPILVRPGTDDAKTIINNIVREEWGDFQPEQPPKWMIDAGAYIGDTSAYFLSRFPSLNVIALEPNPDTFKVTMQNLSHYKERITILNSGLYSSEGFLRFQEGQTNASINNDGKIEISVTTINSLLEKYSIERLDILKMDIEGAEESIFSSKPELWLNNIDWLIIEFHSNSGKASILDILEKNGFTWRQHRSVWYCNRNR